MEVKDISLTDYIQVRHAVYVPHTAGRYAKKQFKKAQMPIVERLVDSLMMKGRNNGKKLMAVRIVAHAFEIIHLLTDQNPIQVRYCLYGFYIYNSTRFRSSLMPLSTPALVKILHESARRVLSVVRLWMYHLFDASTRPLLS